MSSSELPDFALFALHFQSPFWVRLQVEAFKHFFRPCGISRLFVVDTSCEVANDWIDAYRRIVKEQHHVKFPTLSVGVLKVPHDHHVCTSNMTTGKRQLSNKEGAAFNWCYEWLLSAWHGRRPRFFGTLHSDVFPIRPITDVERHLQAMGVYGSTATYGNVSKSKRTGEPWHFHPQLTIWSLAFLDRLRQGRPINFSPGGGYDTGGMMRKIAPVPREHAYYRLTESFVPMVRAAYRACAVAVQYSSGASTRIRSRMQRWMHRRAVVPSGSTLTLYRISHHLLHALLVVMQLR